MQGRSQGIIREEMFPQSRRKFVDSVGRMLPDTLQHIDHIVIGIDLVQSAVHDQALHDPDVFGAELGPTEQPVLAPHRNRL